MAADGGIFTFGDAQFYGSTGNADLPGGIVGMASDPAGTGYWLAGFDGSVYSFGSAQPLGGTGGQIPDSPVVAIAASSSGQGYWLLQPNDVPTALASADNALSLPDSSAIVASATSQVRGDPDIPRGAYCNPYGPCEPWCALFASWVWRSAGVPIPSEPFTGSFYNWAAANGAVLPTSATPAPGDAVLYGTGPQNVNTSLHIGIVAQVWPDGAIVTVEGDAGPAPDGDLSVITNGPFLAPYSEGYNGMPVYGFAQPVR